VLHEPDHQQRDHQRLRRVERDDHLRHQAHAAAHAGRRRAAAAAQLVALVPVALVAAGGLAEADPLRPTTTALGWEVNWDAVVQVDWIPYAESSQDQLNPGTGAPLNEETIYVRRALLRAQARRGRWFAAAELQADNVNGPETRLLDAYVGWSLPATTPAGEPARPPIVTVVGGLILTPFGIEVPTNLRDKWFLEVPTWANALFPGNFDGGVLVKGAYGIARASVAMMDGAPSGDLQWQGRDPSSSYDFIARVGAVVEAPHSPGRLRFDAGLSALTGQGFHAGTPPTKATIQWVDANGNGIVDPSEIVAVPGEPATPSVGFDHDALGGDAMLRWCFETLGQGVAFAEGVLAKNLDRGVVYADPIAAGRDLREAGLSAGVVQDATPWAQVGARYDYYDADRDAAKQAGLIFIQSKQVFSTISVFAAARWATVRLQLQYDHNRNPFGLDVNGLPETRGDDRLTLRAQVMF
jgi:hypothetical protein